MSKYKMIPDGIIASQIAPLQDLYEQYIGYKTDGYFVEIGAFNGWNWSNTVCLIDAGWGGIMVEPNPDLFNELNGRHGKKSKLKLLQLAIGDHDGTAKLYLGGSLSTIKTKSMLEYRYIQGMNFTGLGEDKYVIVDLLTMDSLLSSCMCPTRYDVLVVDVEGAEVDVLNGYDIERHKPAMAIIETHGKHTDERLNWKAPIIDQYFLEHGYIIIYEDAINTIYYCKPLR